MKKKSDKSKINYTIIASIAAGIILILFIAAPVVIYQATENYGNKDAWIGYWGGYVGSFLGVVATILAVGYTYYQNKELHEETKKQNKELQEAANYQNRELHLDTQRKMDEQLRLQIMPAMDVACMDIGIKYAGPVRSLNLCCDKPLIQYHQDDSTDIFRNLVNDSSKFTFLMTIRNVGQGSAVNFCIGCARLEYSARYEGIINGQSDRLYVCIPYYPKFSETIMFYFEDVQGVSYLQELTITRHEDGYISYSGVSCPKIRSNPSDNTAPSTHPPAGADPEPK